MAENRPPVYIVDADRSSRLELMAMVRERGYEGRPFLCGADFAQELPHLPCGILLVDLFNAGDDVFGLIEEVARKTLACPIIAMTGAADAHIAVAALKRGAIDFLEKPVGGGALAEALALARDIMERRRAVFEQSERDGIALARLSDREREVLALLASGMTSREIASDLGLGVRTVEAYRGSLIAKVDAPNAGGAIATFVRFQTARQAQAARIDAAL